MRFNVDNYKNISHGDVIICIDNSDKDKYTGSHLTVGKGYTITDIICDRYNDEDRIIFYLWNDNNKNDSYNSERFYSLREHRNEVINSILTEL